MTNRSEFIASLKLVPARDMIDAVEARGYRVTPITSIDNETRAMGYELHGPRGNRKVIEKHGDGTVSMDAVELWFEMIDYSAGKIAERKRDKVDRARRLLGHEAA